MSAKISSAKTKVSVIIPTYNRAQFIVETLESVFNQTYTNYEVIVVDDGSTDTTRQLLERYEKLANFRYFFQKNQGRSTARNFGMNQAQGEFLMFLDSDDILLPTALETLISIADKYRDSDVIGGQRRFIDNHGNKLDIKELFGLRREVFSENLQIEKIRLFFLCQGSYLIKSDLAKRINGFKPEMHAGEDLDFFLRYCDLAKISVVKDIVVYIRRHENNTSKTEVDEAIYAIACQNFLDLENNPSSYPPSLLKRMKIEWQYKMADDFYVAGRNSEALSHYLKATRIAPELIINSNHLKLTLMTFVPPAIRKAVKRRFCRK